MIIVGGSLRSVTRQEKHDLKKMILRARRARGRARARRQRLDRAVSAIVDWLLVHTFSADGKVHDYFSHTLRGLVQWVPTDRPFHRSTKTVRSSAGSAPAAKAATSARTARRTSFAVAAVASIRARHASSRTFPYSSPAGFCASVTPSVTQQ